MKLPFFITTLGPLDNTRYYRYGYVYDGYKIAYSDTIETLVTFSTTRDDDELNLALADLTQNTSSVWDLGHLTADSLLADPRILTFTQETHPEMFV